MSVIFRSCLFAALSLIAVSACSTPESTTASADTAQDSTAPRDTPLIDTEEACTEGKTVLFMHGSVFDEAGSPLAEARPQACIRPQGRELNCVRASTTDEQGFFTQSVPFEAQCMVSITFRVSLPRSGRATVYCPAELPESSPALAIKTPFVLYPTTRAAELPPKGEPTAVRTVRFAEGLELDVVPDDLYFPSGAYEDMSMAELAADSAGLCFLGGVAPLGLFAFYPESDVADPGLTVRFPNTHQLAAGSEVDLFVLGGLDCTWNGGEKIHEGSWHRFGRGTVSSDGAMVENNPDSPLPCLTWLGYQQVAAP